METRLIYTTDPKRAIAVAVVARLNAMWWGPGGHGKSMLKDEVFEAWEQQGAETMTQAVSIGTNVFDLAGGLHPDYTKQGIYDRPNVEKSWIANADVFCIEEFLDAPPRVMTYLKDILTSRKWRYYDTEVPLRTRSVLGLTNHDPDEIAEEDPSVAALLERFPVRVKMMWPRYSSRDFGAMFDILEGKRVEPMFNGFAVPDWDVIKGMTPVPLSKNAHRSLTAYLGTAREIGLYVSPRTGVYAKAMIGAWAAIQGKKNATEDEFEILELCVGIEGNHKKIMERIQHSIQVEDDIAFIDGVRSNAKKILEAIDSMPEGNTAELIKRAQGIRKVAGEVEKHQWQDETADNGDELKHLLKGIEKRALEKCGLFKGGEDD